MSSPPHRDGPAGDADDVRELELEVAREIAEAFLTATSPLQVYRLALARVTPLVGASFASVFLRDPEDPLLLRLACAQNWPQASARYLSELRIRVGRGPTGRAVGDGRSTEIDDVFADPDLEEWWEPARELGFVSMTSHPLEVDGQVLGALSFYFAERQRFDAASRELLGVVAHQLAATAERADLSADLRTSNLRLERENEALMQRLSAIETTLEEARTDRPDAVSSDRSESEEGSP